MVNAYKEWPTDKLLATGKRLKKILPIALEEAKRLKGKEAGNAMYQIVKGIYTLDALRKEYKKRNS